MADSDGGGGLLDHAVKPRHLKRYKDLGRLVLRYGDAAGVRRAGIQPALEDLHDEEYALVDQGKPEELAADLEKMGPTFVKMGQIMSTRPDLLPQPYLDALARLQDNVGEVPLQDIEQVIEEELGVRISKAFLTFDPKPVAAASLAQVHRAQLRDGREVAVKVQRPNIRDTIRTDIEALAEVAGLADQHTEAGRRYSFSTLLDEFRDALLSELDFQQEARNLDSLADALEEFPLIHVPRPVHDYTTARVITMEFVHGTNVSSLSPITRTELDASALLTELFRAYLHQALVAGLVHADPHPGNVFLMRDGRLALIDLGMVLRIPERMREQLLKLLLAIGDGDGDAAALVCERMGDATSRYDRRAFMRDVNRMVVRVEQGSREEAQMGRVVLAIARAAGEHGLKPPGEITLVGKTLLSLDGVATVLDPHFDPQQVIRDNSVDLARKHLIGSVRQGSIVTSLLETRDFVQDLPGRVNRALDAIGDGDLEVRVRVIDESQMLTGLHQGANRVSMALILASLIVGASLLTRVESSFTVLGYPVLAVLLFLAAAGGGVALLWAIWKGDRKTERVAAEK